MVVYVIALEDSISCAKVSVALASELRVWPHLVISRNYTYFCLHPSENSRWYQSFCVLSSDSILLCLAERRWVWE